MTGSIIGCVVIICRQVRTLSEKTETSLISLILVRGNRDCNLHVDAVLSFSATFCNVNFAKMKVTKNRS